MINTEKKYITIASLGQMVDSSISRSVNAIAQSTGLYNFYVWGAYLIDKIWYKTIEKYKSGQLSDVEFHKQICFQLGINSSEYNIEKFTNDWNAIYDGVFDKARDRLNILGKYTNGQNNVLLISETNKMHYELLKQNMGNELSKFTVILSYEEKTVNKYYLLISGLANMDFNSQDSDLISLHSGITKIFDDHITCFPYNHNQDLNSHMAKIFPDNFITKDVEEPNLECIGDVYDENDFQN